MDLTSPRFIKELLSKYETRASRGLGQNFLIDKNVLKKIIDAADLKPSDTILEIGPGIGTLTQELAKNVSRVIAVEKDKKMVKILTYVLTASNVKNVQVVNTDVLRYTLHTTRYKVVANIPYYLTSPLIRKFLESKNPPKEMILMIQKEVAQRICASPAVASAKEGKTPTRLRQGSGGRGMNLLAVSVQFYAEPKIISYVSKNCFWPSPKVDSAIIKIKPQIGADKKQIDADLFFKIVKAGFSQPRKQIVNNLTSLKSLDGVKLDKVKISNWLLKNNIKPNQRAETLNISDWKNLTESFPQLLLNF